MLIRRAHTGDMPKQQQLCSCSTATAQAHCAMIKSPNVVVDLAEEDTNGLVLCNATIVLPWVVHLDDPHHNQSCNPAEPAKDKAQLAHVLQVNALQQTRTFSIPAVLLLLNTNLWHCSVHKKH